MHFVLRIFNIEALNSWFGFSRRERRSAAILLGIIIVLIAVRFFMPEKAITISEYQLNNFHELNNQVIPVSESVDNQTEGAGVPGPGKNSSGLNSEGKPAKNTYYDNGRTRLTVLGAGDTGVQKRKLIELNGADSATLVSLPGIGPVLSSRIIKFRNLLGGYANIEQLKEVYGLPVETFNLISNRVYADTTLLRLIYINSADYKTLTKFPYFERSEVAAILKYRELKGKIPGFSDLTENKLIKSEKVGKIRPYLRFD